MNSVSVVITCYNYGKYIAGCVESVLGQTFQDFEIIIIDDGSTDNTGEVIAPYLRDSRIHYIKQENVGQAVAKNAGIINSKGEFIAFLDADDLWDHTKLEKQIPLFSDPHVGVVYSDARYINEDGLDVPFEHESCYLKPFSGKITEHLFFDNFIPFSSSIVRRLCIEDSGMFDESIKMGIDWDLWLRISAKYFFEVVQEPLIFYRIGHTGQMSKNLEVRQACTDKIMSRFLSNYPGLVSQDVIRKVKVYTHLSRGYYFRSINAKKAITHYISAIKIDPLNMASWAGLIKAAGTGAFSFISKRHS